MEEEVDGGHCPLVLSPLWRDIHCHIKYADCNMNSSFVSSLLDNILCAEYSKTFLAINFRISFLPHRKVFAGNKKMQNP